MTHLQIKPAKISLSLPWLVTSVYFLIVTDNILRCTVCPVLAKLCFGLCKCTFLFWCFGPVSSDGADAEDHTPPWNECWCCWCCCGRGLILRWATKQQVSQLRGEIRHGATRTGDTNATRPGVCDLHLRGRYGKLALLTFPLYVLLLLSISLFLLMN